MSAATPFDVIVVGAGHNGMVCAFYLAKARRRVLVVDAADTAGGAARPVTFAGATVPLAAQLDYGFSDTVTTDLELERHGLAFASRDIGTTVVEADGRRIDYCLAGDDTAGLAPADAAAWPRFRQRMARFAAVLDDIAHRVPPRLGSGDGADARAWLAVAWRLRRLGREDLREFLRVGAINVFDLLEEDFADPLFKAALAAEAVIGHPLAPRSPGSVLTFLLRFAGHGGSIAMPAGGTPALAAALERACRSRGVKFRFGERVSRIAVENDRAAGVILATGETIAAPLVVSNADVRTTCLDLVGAEHLDTGLVRRLLAVRSRGVSARIDFALDDAIPAGGLDLTRRLILADHMDALERAFNHTKYGEVSDEPMVELVFPERIDVARRSGAGEIVSALVHYAPRDPARGLDAARAGLLANTRAVIERALPGFDTRIVDHRIADAAAIESLTGIDGGHWHHADVALDQYFMLRPVPELARYRLPVAGCWLCGAGGHPGGGVTGMPGRNAAHAILTAREATR